MGAQAQGGFPQGNGDAAVAAQLGTSESKPGEEAGAGQWQHRRYKGTDQMGKCSILRTMK